MTAQMRATASRGGLFETGSAIAIMKWEQASGEGEGANERQHTFSKQWPGFPCTLGSQCSVSTVIIYVT